MAKKQTTTRQYDDMIKRHIDKKDLVKIKRALKEDAAEVNGFILQMSKHFLLIQRSDEFYLNGYCIIRRDHIDTIRCNKFDKTYKRILKAEGIIDAGYGITRKIQLTAWQTIFADLKKNDYHVIVEREDPENPIFQIGPIKKVGKASVGIQYYNPAGVLENEASTVKYPDITWVSFGDRYTTVFRRYLKNG